MSRPFPLLALLLALVAAVGGAAGLDAQEIRGVALGPEGEPLANVPVALHRVGGGRGASVGMATTDEEGRFTFTIEAPDSALYFAILRHGDGMYVGPPINGGGDDVLDYEVRAVPEAEADAVVGALSGGGTAAFGSQGAAVARAAPGRGRGGGGDTGALLLLGLLALAAAITFLVTAPGYRRRRTRDTLVQLATVENRLAGDGHGEDREALERRRDSLRGRLAPRA